ncbi:hypothetical protein N9J83_03810 [Opitutales bacterium]|nr:hypothetical protein [Opitutales bacterium]
MNKSLKLLALAITPFSLTLGQSEGQSSGGESAAESSVTTSSSKKSAAAPETIESNPIVTVVKSGLSVSNALSVKVADIISVAKAGGTLTNLILISKKIEEVKKNPTGKTKFLDNLIAAANQGITFKTTEELEAAIILVEDAGDTEFTSDTLTKIKTNQDAGVSIVQQEEIGVDEVSNAVANGDTVETISALYESVKDLSEEDKAALVSASTAKLSQELIDLKKNLIAELTVSEPVKSNLNLAINAVIADADYTGQSDLQVALTNAVNVANMILADRTISGTASITSDDALNAAALTASGYNTELIKLLIKYGAVGDTGSTLATGALSGFSTTGTTSTSLSTFLTEASSTSDYLGLLSTLTGDTGIGDTDGNDDNFLNSQTNTVLHVSMNKVSLAPGSNIEIGTKGAASTVDVSSILTKATNHDDRKILVIGAAKDLTIAGDTTFTNTNDVEDHALVLGTADELYFRSEYSSANSADYADPDPITLEYTGSNLGLGSESEMRLVNVNIKTGGNLAIASLDKVYIGHTERDNLSTFTVGTGGTDSDPDNVYIYANELIQVNGLAFAGRVDDVYMDAITIDLGNVTFPTNSDVMLRSRDGGLNFGDAARTVGDVNFIENVKHLSISENALTASDFDYSKGDGHINSTSALPNSTPHIKIRSR